MNVQVTLPVVLTNFPADVWFIYCRVDEFATAVFAVVAVSVPAFEFVAESSAVS